MKRTNFILFALFLLLSSGELWAQRQMPYKPAATFNGDTLRYLEYNYTKRQPQYIGKTVETVLKELEYPIIYVMGGYQSGDGPTKLTRLTLGIRQFGKEPNSGARDYYILISFANPPDSELYREASGSGRDNPSPAFSQKVYDFIKDLEISGISSNWNLFKDPKIIEERRRGGDERLWQKLRRGEIDFD